MEAILSATPPSRHPNLLYGSNKAALRAISGGGRSLLSVISKPGYELEGGKAWYDAEHGVIVIVRGEGGLGSSWTAFRGTYQQFLKIIRG